MAVTSPLAIVGVIVAPRVVRFAENDGAGEPRAVLSHDLALMRPVAAHEGNALTVPRRRAVKLDHVHVDDDPSRLLLHRSLLPVPRPETPVRRRAYFAPEDDRPPRNVLHGKAIVARASIYAQDRPL
jgi:hypothetical protein